MNEIWKTDEVNMIHLELSTFCNAACPSCPRYFPGSTVVRSGLELAQITFEQFITWFDNDFLKQIKLWKFCGTHGDPLTAKDIIKIINHIFSNNPTAEIVINTNAGIRKIDDWETLGKISSEYNLKIIFSIDGLKDTNHLYRRNVSWDTLMRNLQTYTQNGGYAIWEFLIFNHNQHQIDDARRLAEVMNCKAFIPKNPLGFQTESGIKDIPVFDQQGNYEYSLLPYLPDNNLNIEKQSRDNHMEFYKSNSEEIVKKYKNKVINFVDDLVSKKANIKCSSKTAAYKNFNSGAEIYINVDGIVYPCCYIGTSTDAFDTSPAALQLHYRLKEINKENFNLNNYTIREILNSNVLSKFTENTWNTDKCLSFCTQTCGADITLVDGIYKGNENK
jgi:MoaA/NifB/PqqE/SkfB family radical SAM enzyme